VIYKIKIEYKDSGILFPLLESLRACDNLNSNKKICILELLYHSPMQLKRRKFLKNSTAILATGIASPYLLSKNIPQPEMNIPADFNFKFYSTNWGYSGDLESFCIKTKKEGYQGIEIWAPRDAKTRENLLRLTDLHHLEFGLLIGTGETDAKSHTSSFLAYADETVELKPAYINCHSGRDYFTMEENKPMLQHSFELEARTGIPIYHETHRGRCLYTAPLTAQYLKTFSALRLTLDISHWTTVHESMLEGQDEAVELAISRTHHIHSRIGYAEGPQVNDPRAPEWEAAVRAHLGWWDRVVQARIKEGKKSLTILTEFGPPPYLPATPFTQMPLADQWAINVYMMQLLRKRWQ